MKKADIGKDRFYSDGKQGLRLVLDMGPQYKAYEGVADDDCLRFRILSAPNSNLVHEVSNATRTGFATWAKAEIPAGEVAGFLLALNARKLIKGLTAPQRKFLLSFDKDLEVGESIECARTDSTVALGCWKKGIVSNVPAKMAPEKKFFNLEFTELGIALVAELDKEEQLAASVGA